MKNAPMNVTETVSNTEIEIHDQSGDPFTAVWNWMLDRPDLTGTEKLVWIALKSFAGCREIRPSVQTVARRAGVGIRTVQRSFEVLTKKELIRVERRTRPDGGFATNRYILLPCRQPAKQGEGGATMTPTPGAIKTPAPGAVVTPPHAPQCHQKNIKQIKNKIPTPHAPLLPENRTPKAIAKETATEGIRSDGLKKAEANPVDEIRKLTQGTAFDKVNDQQLGLLTRKYGFTRVFDTLDRLIETYKRIGATVKHPVSLLSSGLMKGVITPADYVPYRERTQKEKREKELKEQRRIAAEAKRKAEAEAFAKKAEMFDALPEEVREEWLNKARETMHPVLRTSRVAARNRAISLFRGG